jgi:hypothetical protein
MFNQEHQREMAGAGNTADAGLVFGMTGKSACQRHDGVLRRCAWCQRIPVGLNVWLKIEEAMKRLPFISTKMLGEATHGICPECYDAFLSKK